MRSLQRWGLLITIGFGALLTRITSCSRPSSPTDKSIDAASAVPSIAAKPSQTILIPDTIGGASAEMGRAVFLAEGRVAVGDLDGKRLLVFNSTGNLVRIIGRSGSGPGEFRAPILIQAFADDSLLVWDSSLRRLTRLSATTGTGSNIQLPAKVAYGGRPIVGLLGDRRIVLRNERFAPDAQTGLMTVTTEFGILDPGSEHVTPMITWPAVPNGDANGFRFFSPRVQAAVINGDYLSVGYGDDWQLLAINGRGDTLGVLTRPWQPSLVTESERKDIREALTRPDMAPDFLDDERFDPTHPAFGTILSGPSGTTWVLGYAAPYLAPDSVSVFGADRRLLTVLAVPPDFRPTDVGRDYILGTGTTDDGDFEIRKYRLEEISGTAN